MTPAQKKLMRALEDDVLGTRADAAIVRPFLRAMIRTAVQDFERYYDPALADTRIRDHAILLAVEQGRKAQRARATDGEEADNPEAPAV